MDTCRCYLIARYLLRQSFCSQHRQRFLLPILTQALRLWPGKMPFTPLSRHQTLQIFRALNPATMASWVMHTNFDRIAMTPPGLEFACS